MFLTPEDAVLGLACVAFLVIWYTEPVSRVVNNIIWGVAGVSCWCMAFRVQGRLTTRGNVKDNIRVARHTWFVMCVLCLGSAVACTVEALAAHFVEPWYMQVSVNTALSLAIFTLGLGIFKASHEWVVRDPRLEPPLWSIVTCVVS